MTTFLEPPVPAVYTVQVCQVPNVQNTFETPQSQTVEKIVEHPEIRTFQGTRASESLETAPGRHVAFSEIVEVVDFEPTLSVESALPISVTTPGVEAAPVEYVQTAPVAEYVTPASAAPAFTHAAPAPVVESVPVPIVEKTIEIPQLQIVEEIIDIPETQTFRNHSLSTSCACGVSGSGGIGATCLC